MHVNVPVQLVCAYEGLVQDFRLTIFRSRGINAQATRIGLSRRWQTLTTPRLRCVALRSSRGSTASRGRQSWSLLVPSEYGTITPILTCLLDIKETGGRENKVIGNGLLPRESRWTELSMKDIICPGMNDERRADHVIRHSRKLDPTFDLPFWLPRSTTGEIGTHVLVDISSWHI